MQVREGCGKEAVLRSFFLKRVVQYYVISIITQKLSKIHRSKDHQTHTNSVQHGKNHQGQLEHLNSNIILTHICFCFVLFQINIIYAQRYQE